MKKKQITKTLYRLTLMQVNLVNLEQTIIKSYKWSDDECQYQDNSRPLCVVFCGDAEQGNGKISTEEWIDRQLVQIFVNMPATDG